MKAGEARPMKYGPLGNEPNEITLVADQNVSAGDVVTVAHWACYPLGCPHGMTVDTAELVVRSR